MEGMGYAYQPEKAYYTVFGSSLGEERAILVEMGGFVEW